jgi:glutamate synthase domain-containing protein 3
MFCLVCGALLSSMSGGVLYVYDSVSTEYISSLSSINDIVNKHHIYSVQPFPHSSNCSLHSPTNTIHQKLVSLRPLYDNKSSNTITTTNTNTSSQEQSWKKEKDGEEDDDWSKAWGDEEEDNDDKKNKPTPK